MKTGFFNSFCALAICVLISIAASEPVSAQTAAGSIYRDFNCFMKEHAGLDRNGAADAALIVNISALNISDDEKKANLEKSEKLYFKYESEIKKLIGEFDKIMAEKVPVYDQAKADRGKLTDKILEFNYCRNLSKLLKAASNYLLIKGRYEDSLKLILINFKFGQIIAAGDGEVLTLLTHLIGDSIKITALSGPETQVAFRKAGLTADRYDELSKLLERMDGEEIGFSDVIKSDQAQMKNCVKHDLFSNGGTFFMDPAAIKTLNNLSARQKADVEKLTLEKIDSIEAEICDALSKYSDRPYMASIEMSKISDEVARNSRPALFQSLFNKPEAISNLIVGIAHPNFSRSYEQYAAVRYRTSGLIFLCRILKNFSETGKWPDSLSEIEKICGTSLSRDLFSKSDDPLIFTRDKSRFFLYSRGIDYNDDHGDNQKDIILFEVRP